MKISGRIDGSIYGAIVCSRPRPGRPLTATAVPVAARAIALHDYGRRGKTHALGIAVSRRCAAWPASPPGASVFSYSTVTARARRRPLGSNFFTPHNPGERGIRSHTSTAVAVDTCSPIELPGPAEPPTPAERFSPAEPVRSAVLPVAPFAAAPKVPPKSKDDLLDLVGSYDDITVEERLEFLKDPYMRRYAPPEAPSLHVSDQLHELSSPTPDEVERGDQDDLETVTKLRAAVFSKLMRPHSVDLETIYDLYLQLPGQRVPYLPARLRHALFAALGISERKNPKSMLRYFAVVADTKNSGFSLTRTEWNTALSFASRYVGVSTDVEAEAALRLWREMEHDVGMKGNEVTFNILFDVATKAGKFALAEMVYQEMVTRGFSFNRYHHVSLIHFFGLKYDSGGVRAAYREMVHAGEIIDSTTLNAVLVGLLRSGEEASAERLYAKMKASDERSKIIPERNYTLQKKMSKVLMMFARLGRKHPELRQRFQNASLTTPDLHTYRILVNHYGVRLGNLSKVTEYLDEMKWFRVPLHGSIFLALFKAFTRHGETAGSDWTPQRLDSVWEAFLHALDEGADGLYISTWIAMWALRAFANSSRSQDRVLQVYGELSSRWDLDAQNESFMVDFLHKLLQRNGLYHRHIETGIGPQ